MEKILFEWLGKLEYMLADTMPLKEEDNLTFNEQTRQLNEVKKLIKWARRQKFSHESSGLNKPVVTVSLPLSNEQILKGIQTSSRYQLPKEWLKNEHTNSNYMGGFLNAVKWMEGNAR